jgi:tetratricopeptide (TPR) repeat protein
MRFLLVAFTLFLANISARAQLFAFVKNETGAVNTENQYGYKLIIARKVFHDLVRARGDLRMQPPTLVMNKGERYVAWMDQEQVQIGIEEKAYDLCTSFGKDSMNALAALLAHEVTHYYEKHDWSRHFVRENESIETAKELERLEEGLKHEAQADYLGGFLAFSAGYNTYGIMPELLKKIYQGYHLPEKLPGYPVLADRLSMVDGAMARLQELSIEFETAYLLTVLGQYTDAALYHKSILQSYQSREIYNNAGVNTVLAALQYFSPKEMPYLLPLELDAQSRLTTSRNVDAERLEKRKSLLQSALLQFEQAIVLDNEYVTGYLNRGVTLALLGAYEDAVFWLNKGQKKCATQKMTTDFLTMKGIVEALQGNTEAAVKYLNESKTIGSYLAIQNLNIVQNTVPPTGPLPGPDPVPGVEQIEWYKLADFLAQPAVDKEVTVTDQVFCGLKQRQFSRIFIHYANNGKEYVVVQQTLPDYKGATLRGITLKSSADNIQEAYGVPKSNLALPDGAVWVYPEQHIYFRFNHSRALVNWGVYLQSP